MAIGHSADEHSIGSELIIDYIAQIENLHYTHNWTKQLTKNGNTQIQTQLLFRSTDRQQIGAQYPDLLSDVGSLVVVLSYFNAQQPSVEMYEEWSNYIHVTTRFNPTSFQYQWKSDDGVITNMAVKIAMPRDICIEPVRPHPSTPKETVTINDTVQKFHIFPEHPAKVSFAGPIDGTILLKEACSLTKQPQRHICFVKLSAYINPAQKPGEPTQGYYHHFYVAVFMPILVPKFNLLFGKLVNGNRSPLNMVNDILFVAGQVIGTLNKELLVTPFEDEIEILVVVPDNFKVFTQSMATEPGPSIISTTVLPETPRTQRTTTHRPLATTRSSPSPISTKIIKRSGLPTAQHKGTTVSNADNERQAGPSTTQQLTNVKATTAFDSRINTTADTSSPATPTADLSDSESVDTFQPAEQDLTPLRRSQAKRRVHDEEDDIDESMGRRGARRVRRA